jgi:ubiquinone/menaquinone biosynthesis C-methylase UbiE
MLATRDDQIQEWLDADEIDPVALRRNLRDIRRINAILGWTALAVRSVARYVRVHCPAGFTLLDVASGSADIPLAIARWAARSGMPARIVASDISPAVVTVAREQAARMPSISVACCDALALPYAAGSFDIALCTLALHHFERDRAVALLREMGRVGRQVMVFDAERHPLAYLGVISLTRLIPMDAMTRHDAPASVRRAYTAPELRALARRAGLADVVVRVGFPFRLALLAAGFPPALGRAGDID